MKGFFLIFLCIGMFLTLLLSLACYWQGEMAKATYWMLVVILDVFYLQDISKEEKK